jgi:hypothetical protein
VATPYINSAACKLHHHKHWHKNFPCEIWNSYRSTVLPLPPGNIPGAHFCERLSQPRGHSAARRINHSYQHYSNILAATHLKITAKWKPLWYNGSQQRTRTSINRGYRSSFYNKINSRTVVGTMWRSGGIALLLNMDCSFLKLFWTELQGSHEILTSIAKKCVCHQLKFCP